MVEEGPRAMIEARLERRASRLGGSAALYVDGQRLGVFVGKDAGPLEIPAGPHSVHVRLGAQWTEPIEVVAKPGERIVLVCRFQSFANATARGLVTAAFLVAALVLGPILRAVVPGAGLTASILTLGLGLVIGYAVAMRIVSNPVSDLELVRADPAEAVG